MTLCGLVWAFVGALTVKKSIPLLDDLAIWTHKNPSESNMLITVASTVLGVIGSFLLGVTAQHALTARLSHQVQLSVVTAWIQFATNTLFLRPRRHLRWTLISGLCFCVIHFLTVAWSNLLTPEHVIQRFAATEQELDFLSPAVANYTYHHAKLPPVLSTNRSYSLVPADISLTTSFMDNIQKAGSSAAMASVDTKRPSYFDGFKSSTGGGLPPKFLTSRLGFPRLDKNYGKGLSTTYTSVQQGYTANISCMMSSSPTIALNNSASVEHTFNLPSGRRVSYTLQTWSWNTNCSGNAKRYTGEVNIMAGNHSHGERFTTTGLLATSVCFYQDFYGPSNQSFLVLMQSTNGLGYDGHYSVAKSNLLTVCQVIPMVTTMNVKYNESGSTTVQNVLEQSRIPHVSWPLVLFPGLRIWEAYLLGQGPYANSMADSVMDMGHHGIMPILENYLRGIVEYLGTSERYGMTLSLTRSGQPLPDDMTTMLSGTLDVHTMGWVFHPRTHGIAVAAITLLTVMTVVSGTFALVEANRQKRTGGALQKGATTSVLNPTDLMDVLVASSMGSLAGALSRYEDRENLWVELAVTDDGQPVLNAR